MCTLITLAVQVIGWRDPPVRHMLIVITDASFHVAGDGKVCVQHICIEEYICIQLQYINNTIYTIQL